MTVITVILANASNSLSSWTVPSDCQSAQVECYGAGSGGQNFGSGGASGAYAIKNNLVLTPGATIQYMVPFGGIGGASSTSASNNDGGAGSSDTWFNGTTSATASCSANSASNPSNGFSSGGSATSSIGDTTAAGYHANFGGSNSGAGGAGAPGPTGNGGAPGGSTFGGGGSSSNGGTGGGGANGGLGCLPSTSNNGVNGGTGQNGGGNGAGSTSPTVNGGNGSTTDPNNAGGGGGGCGANTAILVSSNGGNGGYQPIYTDSYTSLAFGPGSGAGAAGGTAGLAGSTGLPAGGNGGYGAGGGSGGYTGSGYGAGGNGGQGFIVITYVSSTPVNNSNKFLVKLKNSGVAGHVPTTLSPGEIAINYVDNLIYAANSSNVVSVIASVVPQTANSFSTNSTISLSNAATGSVSFNGATNVSIATTANFTSSKGTNGYATYPSGIHVCWGSSTLAAGTKTVTFATPFPTACTGITATSRGTAVATQLPIFVKTPTTTTCVIYANTSATYTFSYIAYGY
jgi:hypothetical protein